MTQFCVIRVIPAEGKDQAKIVEVSGKTPSLALASKALMEMAKRHPKNTYGIRETNANMKSF